MKDVADVHIEWEARTRRHVSKLADAPFIKFEASKFTEVGYVGWDVESL